VVITPYGGTKEYFGSMAEYVEPASTASIRAGIKAALAKPRGPELREHIRGRFLWQSVAEQTAAAYASVARGGQS
jgi:glycosyltransferase involved in cell wall biosynthesis